jgi:hypothetical protein
MAGLRLRTMTKPALRVGTARVRITLMIVGVFTGLSGGIHAQEAPAGDPARPIAASADRIARELWSADDSTSTDEQGRPRFRASITVDEFVLPPPWYENDPTIGRYRRRGTASHQEFLSLVTPEAFRASTLNTGGVSVDPGTILGGFKSAWRSWQEKRVRERIEREVAELRARAAAEASPPPDR